MAFRPILRDQVDPGKSGLLSPQYATLGIAAKRYAEVARLRHRPSDGNAGLRERTRGGATRDTNIVNRERQRIVQNSASFTSERDCVEVQGSVSSRFPGTRSSNR